NDFTVMLVAAVYRNTIYVKDIVRKKLDFPSQRDTLIALARQHAANVILIEKAATGAPMAAELARIAAPGVPRPICITVKGSKEQRVTACSGGIEAGDLLLPKWAPWKDDFLDEMCGFPHARHDDQVDAVTLLMKWLANQRRGGSGVYGGGSWGPGGSFFPLA